MRRCIGMSKKVGMTKIPSEEKCLQFVFSNDYFWTK